MHSHLDTNSKKTSNFKSYFVPSIQYGLLTTYIIIYLWKCYDSLIMQIKTSTLSKLWNLIFIYWYYVLKSESKLTCKNLAIISTNLAPINLNDFKRISLKFWKIRSHLILICTYWRKLWLLGWLWNRFFL